MGEGRRYYIFICPDCGTEFWVFPIKEDEAIYENLYEDADNLLMASCPHCPNIRVDCNGFSMVPKDNADSVKEG
jgi:phage terminase large subunit GpA-like protein